MCLLFMLLKTKFHACPSSIDFNLIFVMVIFSSYKGHLRLFESQNGRQILLLFLQILMKSHCLEHRFSTFCFFNSSCIVLPLDVIRFNSSSSWLTNSFFSNNLSLLFNFGFLVTYFLFNWILIVVYWFICFYV